MDAGNRRKKVSLYRLIGSKRKNSPYMGERDRNKNKAEDGQRATKYNGGRTKGTTEVNGGCGRGQNRARQPGFHIYLL